MPKINIINNDNELTDHIITTTQSITTNTMQVLEQQSCSININFVGQLASADYNTRFRAKSGPTNVLSFPNPDTTNLGNLIICFPVICQEATEDEISPEFRLAHIIIHGILHLCGYDHQQPNEAKIMEDLESKTMQQLGYPSPWD